MRNNEEIPSKAGKGWLSETIAWIHLWPGLISAVILIFVCLTGTIIVYCDEVVDFANRDVLYITPSTTAKLPAEQLLARYRKTYPERVKPDYLVFYRDPGRTVALHSSDPENGFSITFMDPYAGEILKDDATIHFFQVMALLHSSLLWPGPGNWIIDIATAIFMLELFTGLVLWWPSRWNQTTRRASFTIKWKASLKRVNYDLHNVFGFYAFSICFLLALTGLLIGVKPLARLTTNTFGGDTERSWIKNLPAYEPGNVVAEINPVLEKLFSDFNDKEAIQVFTASIDTMGYYHVNVASRIGMKSCENCDPYTINRHTGERIDLPESASEYSSIENGYWALHMGTWVGQVGKFFTFTGGLVATSLPVTGFLIWWGKRKKSVRKRRADTPSNIPRKIN